MTFLDVAHHERTGWEGDESNFSRLRRVNTSSPTSSGCFLHASSNATLVLPFLRISSKFDASDARLMRVKHAASCTSSESGCASIPSITAPTSLAPTGATNDDSDVARFPSITHPSDWTVGFPMWLRMTPATTAGVPRWRNVDLPPSSNDSTFSAPNATTCRSWLSWSNLTAFNIASHPPPCATCLLWWGSIDSDQSTQHARFWISADLARSELSR
mmetsp:Transcript_32560/g.69326  ORF Transcript_32560/g.69326 Transcript_32560/m.69326 type:complete len:216 (-) Transcript_32560:345-992(-)